MPQVDDRLNVRGESAPRHDPYRFWVSGLLLEIATFVMVILALSGLVAFIVWWVG